MSRAKGNIAEDRACDFLRERDYTIIERNFYTKFGEIDIIVLKEQVLHFVE
ncbi:MAG TPA: YraN family protein, partial [Helicobacteraceae bacterium]|nr:YraN family protein [Helicobacteraceae bacterium]